MKKRHLVILLIILITLTTLISAADLDLQVTGTINDYTADTRLKTNTNAESTLDGYDMISPSSPSDYATLTSTVETKSLSIDTWDAEDNPRTINLVYEITPSQTGTLSLTWNSVTGGYTAQLTDYGEDDTYTTAVSTVDMTSTSSYEDTTFSSDRKRYMTVVIDTSTTPPPPPVETAAGGGAAGGAAAEAAITDFTISQDLIKTVLKQGANKREYIRITNTGTITINIGIRAENIDHLVAIGEDSFSLKPGESKSVKLDFFAKEEEPIDAYIGRIIVTGAGIRKIINVIIEVREKKPLFDIRVNIVKKKLEPGDDVEATIEVTNMGDLEYIDILIYYAIKDFQGNTILFREESLAIRQNLKIPRDLEIPDNLPPGDYVFYSKVSFENIVATSADTFKVVSKKPGTFLSNIGAAFFPNIGDTFFNTRDFIYDSLSNRLTPLYILAVLILVGTITLLIRKRYRPRMFIQRIPVKKRIIKRLKNGKN